MITVYVSIGNSDDKLTQDRWATFTIRVRNELRTIARKIHGQWYSAPDDPFQNACFCVEIEPEDVDDLKVILGAAAATFEQDSVTWAEVSATEFIGKS